MNSNEVAYCLVRLPDGATDGALQLETRRLSREEVLRVNAGDAGMLRWLNTTKPGDILKVGSAEVLVCLPAAGQTYQLMAKVTSVHYTIEPEK